MQIFIDWVRKNPKVLLFYPLIGAIVALCATVPVEGAGPLLIGLFCFGIIAVTIGLVIGAYVGTLNTMTEEVIAAHREESLLWLTSAEKHAQWVPGPRNQKLIEPGAALAFVYVPPPGTEPREPQLAYLAAPTSTPRQYHIDDFAGSSLGLVAKSGKTVEVEIEEPQAKVTITWDNWRQTRQAAQIADGSYFYFCCGFNDALQLYYVLRDGRCITELLEAKYAAFAQKKRKA